MTERVVKGIITGFGSNVGKEVSNNFVLFKNGDRVDLPFDKAVELRWDEKVIPVKKEKKKNKNETTIK